MGWQRQDHVWLGQSEKGEPPTNMLVPLSIQNQDRHADREAGSGAMVQER